MGGEPGLTPAVWRETRTMMGKSASEEMLRAAGRTMRTDLEDIARAAEAG